jgi:hypothetical protein
MDKEHKNSALEKIDMQVVSVEACNIDDVKTSFASLADKEDLHLDPDLMYAKFIMCHEGANSNGDFFTNEVLFRAQHTPRFKPIDWEHGQPMIGHILESRYAEDAEGRGYIEAIGVIWKFIYPQLADEIKRKSVTGELRLSMECYFKDANYKYGEQIFDQEQAEELGIAEYVGREYMGQKVYRVFKDVIFGGVGVVANPADKEAVFLAVAKKHAQEVMDNNEVVNNLTDEQIQAIANIIRNTNDFREKEISKDTVDAVTVAKFVKSFDKAKSEIVNRFNKDNITTKEQLVSEVRSIIDSLLADVSNINNDYFLGKASEDSEDSALELDLSLKLCDQCSNIEVAEENKGGSETMANEHTHEVVNEEVVEETVVTEETTEEVTNQEEVVTEEVTEPVSEEVETVDYQAKASELETELSELKDELLKKDEALTSLKEEFDALKNKVEASEKEEMINTRMAELAELGVEFSEARKAKEVEKISAMDNDSFVDYKEFLSELVGNKPDVVEATEEVVEEEVVEEEVEVEVEKAEATELNIETPQPKVIKPFGHLSE